VPCPACCGAQAVVYSRLRRAGVPSKYQVLTMDGWVERVAAIQPEEARPQYRAALAAARRLARFQAPPEGERAGLLLSGPPGRMKSGLAAAVVVEASRLGAQARWLAWGSYCDQLNELREAGQSVRDEIEAVAGAELLVVDDLGADGIISDWRTRILVDLLERRGSPPGRVLPTIVTTMLRLDDLSSRYGDHAASRLLEVCAPIALTGLDARRNKA